MREKSWEGSGALYMLEVGTYELYGICINCNIESWPMPTSSALATR